MGQQIKNYDVLMPRSMTIFMNIRKGNASKLEEQLSHIDYPTKMGPANPNVGFLSELFKSQYYVLNMDGTFDEDCRKAYIEVGNLVKKAATKVHFQRMYTRKEDGTPGRDINYFNWDELQNNFSRKQFQKESTMIRFPDYIEDKIETEGVEQLVEA